MPNSYGFDYQSNKENIDLISAAEKEEEERKRKALEQAELEAKQKEQDQALLRDSHAAKKPSDFGPKENAKEITNAIAGGIRDTVSSIATAPERYADMASGEMQQEGDNYKPGWDPLGNDLNPINKTWWGQFLRNSVHFGTMAGAVIAGSRVPGVRNVVSKAAATSIGSKIAGNQIAKAAVIGAASDLVSEYSQDANGLATLRDRFGFIDTPLSTKDSDHPILKTLKNVAEGMGVGVAIDRVWMAIAGARTRLGQNDKPDRAALEAVDKQFEINRTKAEEAAKAAVDKLLRNDTEQYLFARGVDFKGLPPDEQIQQMIAQQKRTRTNKYNTWSPPETNEQRAARKIEERGKSVEDQTIEKGVAELEDEGFRGHKNKPIADPWQGSPNSTGSAYDIHKQAKRISTEWGAARGSTDNIITPAAAERMANAGFGTKDTNQMVARELYGDVRFNRLITELRSQRKNFDEVFGDAFARMQEVVGGRDATALTPDEYWKPIMRDLPKQTGGKDSVDAWAVENIIAADLINASLFTKLRDLSNASLMLKDVADITDIDGPIKSIRDNLIVGLTQVKRSRYIISDEFRRLGAQDPSAIRARDQRLSEIHLETKDQVDMMLELAQKSPTNDLLHAILEAFSVSNKIHNWDDFSNYMSKRLLGETTESGLKKTGLLIRELQAVMANGLISSPKTPVRALMGTSTAVFTRPIAQIVGGAIRYVGTGFDDAHTFKEGLASLNATMHALPEAYTYFKERLSGYWSGDIANYSTRFSEYSPSDEHWDLMGEWAKADTTSWGEKLAYHVATAARSINNSALLNYSPKLMAATDDSFKLILARQMARQKAFREALDSQATGIIPDITPSVLKEFEDRFYNQIFDPVTGSVTDDFLKTAIEEATLTKDLSNFGRSIDSLFSNTPLLKPFFFFARTGINGLEFTAKHTPLLNLAVKEVRDIMSATPETLDSVRAYGITNEQELFNARAIQNGRLAIGTTITMLAVQQYLAGNLRGNGPVDAQVANVMKDARWTPRSVRINGAWISYESMEPFNQILAAVADIGDNMRLMGPEWAEQNFMSVAFIVAKAAVSKTYLQGLDLIVDLFGNVGNDPAMLSKVAASLANNTVPMTSLRNDLGKIITPYTRELSSSWQDQLRNRNLFFEQLAGGDALPIKYDLLNGKPIRDDDVVTRIYNSVIPIQLNLETSPGRELLFRSGYDLRQSVFSAPDGTRLSKNSKVRSMFQRAIGAQNVEKKLNELASDPTVQDSLQRMELDIKQNRRGINPMSYTHNKLIRQEFEKARAAAWASLQSDPDVQKLRSAATKMAAAEYNRNLNESQSRNQYDEAQQILQMTNK